MSVKKIVKSLLILSIIVLLPLNLTFIVSAHPGRTDSQGGHKDKNNESAFGYYHYHCNDNPPHLHKNEICPYYKNQSEFVKPSYIDFDIVTEPALILFGYALYDINSTIEFSVIILPENASDKTYNVSINNGNLSGDSTINPESTGTVDVKLTCGNLMTREISFLVMNCDLIKFCLIIILTMLLIIAIVLTVSLFKDLNKYRLKQ